MGGQGALPNPEELETEKIGLLPWRLSEKAFKTTILDVAGGCLGTHRKVKKNFVSQGTLDSTD